MENSANLNGMSFPDIKDMSDKFIRQIDKNHDVHYGKHVKQTEVTTTDLRRPIPDYDEKMANVEEREQFDMRYSACLRLQNRLARNELVSKETKNLTVKQVVGKIITAGLIVITAGTCVGHVAAYYSTNSLDMNDTKIENQSDKIIPTEAELNAGLTQDQLAAKHAIDSGSMGRSR